MTKVTVVVADNGTGIIVHNIQIENSSLANHSTPPILQFQVNGELLSPDQSKLYFSDSTKPWVIAQTDQQRLVRALGQPFASSRYLLPENTALAHTAQNNMAVDQMVDGFVQVCGAMDDVIGETIIETAKEYTKFNISTEAYLNLRRGLGNRAFRRANLLRNFHHDVAHFIFNEPLSIAATGISEFAERMENFYEHNPNGELSNTDLGIMGVGAATKTAVLYKIFNTTRYKQAFDFAEVFFHKALSRGAARFGIAYVHPVLATAATIYTSAVLIDEYWDDIWGLTTDALSQVWNYRSVNPTVPLSAADTLLTPVPLKKPGVPIVNSQSTQTAAAPALLLRPRVTTDEKTFSASALPQFQPKDFLPRPPNVYAMVLGEALKSKRLFTFDSKSEKTMQDAQLKLAQQVIKNFFELQTTKHQYFNPFPSEYVEPDTQPLYLPGERGSFSMNNDNGRLNYAVRVDPIKAPVAAGVVVALHLLVNQIKWWRLKEHQKAVILFNNEIEKLRDARAQDWTNFRVLGRRVTGASYDDIQKIYCKNALNYAKQVIETHANDLDVRTKFKAYHFALASGSPEFIGKVIDKDDSALVEISENHLSDKLGRFNQQMQAEKFTDADKTAHQLTEQHAYDSQSHIACAQAHNKLNQFPATLADMEKAEALHAQEKNLVVTLPVQHADGHILDKNDHPLVKNVNAVQQQINLTRFSLKYKQYEIAPQNQKLKCLKKLLDHTAQCIAENEYHTQYLDNHVQVLLLAGKNDEAVVFKSRLCNLSPDKDSYHFLGALHEKLNNVPAATKAFIEALKYTEDKAEQYSLRCMVRDNFLKLNDHPQALLHSNNIYNSDHAKPIDSYLHGVLCIQNKKFDDAYIAFEKYINAHVTDMQNGTLSPEQQGFIAIAYIGLGEISRFRANNATASKFAKQEVTIKEALEFYKTVTADKTLFASAENQFNQALKIDPTNQTAAEGLQAIKQQKCEYLTEYGNLLFRCKDYAKAEEQFKGALAIDSNYKTATDKLYLMQVESVKELGFNIASRLFHSRHFQHFLRRHLPTTVHTGLQLTRQGHQLFGEFLNFTQAKQEGWRQLIDMRSFRANWSEMNGALQGAFVMNKAAYVIHIFFPLVEKAVHYAGYEMSESVRNGVQNTAIALQAGGEMANIYGLIASAQLGAGISLIVVRSLDIAETLVRGGHKLYYGEYMARPENMNYLFTKNFLAGSGAIAFIYFTAPTAMSVIATSVMSKATTLLSYAVSPDTASYAVIGAVAAGTFTGLYYYADSAAWYEKLNNIQVNGELLAGQNKHSEAICKLREAYDLKPDETITADIRKNIVYVSERRLEKAIKEKAPDNKPLTRAQLQATINAYDEHLAEVPDDKERVAQKEKLQSQAKIYTAFEQAGEFSQAREHSSAEMVFENLLTHPLDEKTRVNVKAAKAEQKLLAALKDLESAKVEPDVKDSKQPTTIDSKRKLSFADLTLMAIHLKEYLAEAPDDKGRSKQYTDIKDQIEIQTYFNEKREEEGFAAWKKIVDAHPEDKEQAAAYRAARSEQKLNAFLQKYSKPAKKDVDPNVNLENQKQFKQETVEPQLTVNELKEIAKNIEEHLKEAPNDQDRRKQLFNIQIQIDLQSIHYHLQEKKYDEGLKLWEKFIADHPDDQVQFKAYRQAKCVIYTQDKTKHDEAKKLCEDLIQQEAQEATGWRCRAQLRLMAGENELARRDIHVWIALDEKDPTAYQQLAYIEHAAGNLALAKQWAAKAVSLLQANTVSADSKAIDPAKKIESETSFKRAQEQLVAIETEITFRWHHNLVQVFNGLLQAIAQHQMTMMSLDIYRAKPLLPRWFKANSMHYIIPEPTVESAGEIDDSATNQALLATDIDKIVLVADQKQDEHAMKRCLVISGEVDNSVTYLMALQQQSADTTNPVLLADEVDTSELAMNLLQQTNNEAMEVTAGSALFAGYPNFWSSNNDQKRTPPTNLKELNDLNPLTCQPY